MFVAVDFEAVSFVVAVAAAKESCLSFAAAVVVVAAAMGPDLSFEVVVVFAVQALVAESAMAVGFDFHAKG